MSTDSSVYALRCATHRREAVMHASALSIKRCCATVAFIALSAAGLPSLASCPAGDPSVLYCDDFSGANPLASYTVVNPWPSPVHAPYVISITNGELVFAGVPGAPLTAAMVALPAAIEYKNTVFEADVRFDTASAALRSSIHLEWVTPDTAVRLVFWLQLDEQTLGVWIGSSVAGLGERAYPQPLLPGRTYRMSFKIEEVAGNVRPTVLAFKGYIDGTQVFSETEESLGIDILASLPTQLHPAYLPATYNNYPVSHTYDNAIVRKQLRLACSGFEPPLADGPVTVNKNRALPFKALLSDASNGMITDLGSVPPVIQVTYSPLTGNALDVTDLAVAAGLGTEGNQFVYADGKWQFNLQTKAYTAKGTYTVNMLPGDGYSIEPTCSGSFMVK